MQECIYLLNDEDLNSVYKFKFLVSNVQKIGTLHSDIIAYYVWDCWAFSSPFRFRTNQFIKTARTEWREQTSKY